MRTTKSRLGVVLAAGAVALGVGAVAAGAQIDDGRPSRNLVYTERATAVTPIDLGAPGPSQGDQFVVASELLDSHDRTIATGGGVCTIISTSDVVCHGTQVFGDGQVSLQGVVPLAVLSGGGRYSLAITGGTGAYRNARGEVLGNQIDSRTSEGVGRISLR